MSKPEMIKIRRKMMKQRLFDASKTENIWSTWSNTPKHINQIIHEDLSKLVAKSREQYANNDYVKRYVGLCQTNISGENGVMVQSKVMDRQGNQDTPIQQVIEQAWDSFSTAVDPSDTCSRAEFEAQVIQACAIDGESFVMRHISKKYRYGVAFSIIDAALCDTTYHDTDKNIISGIEYDSDSKPVAYYFSKASNHAAVGYYQPKDYHRIPADKIIHVFMPEWAGQKRGIPWTATSLGRLRTLKGFEDAAVTAARVGATKMGFFTSENGGEYTGEMDSYGDMIMEAEPGSFEQLPEGVSFQSWDPNYPSNVYGDFVTAALRGIAVGLGVSHHSLTGDMSGVNYTSSRTALLDERDQWKRKQKWLINRLVRKMYESFIDYGVDFGRININGKQLRENPSHYYPATYLGRRWQWVDPAKEVVAIEKALQLKLKSLSTAIRETGADPESTWNEMARDEKTLKKLGLLVYNEENSKSGLVNDED